MRTKAQALPTSVVVGFKHYLNRVLTDLGAPLSDSGKVPGDGCETIEAWIESTQLISGALQALVSHPLDQTLRAAEQPLCNVCESSADDSGENLIRHRFEITCQAMEDFSAMFRDFVHWNRLPEYRFRKQVEHSRDTIEKSLANTKELTELVTAKAISAFSQCVIRSLEDAGDRHRRRIFVVFEKYPAASTKVLCVDDAAPRSGPSGASNLPDEPLSVEHGRISMQRARDLYFGQARPRESAADSLRAEENTDEIIRSISAKRVLALWLGQATVENRSDPKFEGDITWHIVSNGQK
jgi:hypothetical protein